MQVFLRAWVAIDLPKLCNTPAVPLCAVRSNFVVLVKKVKKLKLFYQQKAFVSYFEKKL